MSTKEKIRGLLDEGLSPQEVADKVGVKRQTVYHYRYLFRKEDEPVAKTETKNVAKRTQSESEKINELKEQLRSADKEVDRIKQDNEYYKGVVNNLEKDNGKLRAEAKNAKNELNAAVELSTKEAEELIFENSAAQHKIETLLEDKNKLTETLYKREQLIAQLRDELEIELAKHKHLRSYSLLLMREEGAANAQ